MKRLLPIIMIVLFLSGLVSVIPNLATMSTLEYNLREVTTPEFIVPPALEAQVKAPESIRVAVYNEANVTVPDYSNTLGLTNNYSEVVTLLTGAGYQVSLVTEDDILDYELTLANYDVFVMVNNLPRVSIVNLVKEFWLDGGGVLSFNSAYSYLFYYGLLGPEFETNYDGAGSYWQYLSSDEMNITARHPITQEYQINDSVFERAENWLTFWAPIWSPSYYDSVNDQAQTLLLNNLTTPTYGFAVAIDSQYRGGKVVQLPGDGYSIPTAFESIIIESVDYLAPRPKARIAFDFSHQPRLGIDSWDYFATIYYDSIHNYEQLRNLYVNHSYTFDKFYPSSGGNFTAERLANYDVIVIDYPDLNHTVSEREALMNWVDSGGSLMILGDRTGMLGPNDGASEINRLIQDLDMSLGTSDIIDYQVASRSTPYHTTTEGCTGLAVGYRNYIVVTGEADSIYEYSGNTVVAAQDYGNGRVVLFSDMNILDSELILQQSNEWFAITVMNWLSASEAEVLLYTSTPYASTVYRNDISRALNELGLEYRLHIDEDFFNDTLKTKNWSLVIVDAPTYYISGAYGGLEEYVDSGGRLLMSDFAVDNYPSNTLWEKLGFAFVEDWDDEDPLYIWDADHSIFNIPNDYGDFRFELDSLFFDDGDRLHLLDGATGLAGASASEALNESSIVLANDGRTLYNGYLISALMGDYDDSTYSDAYELWMNEIAFMLRPTIDSPSDITYESGTTGSEITWTPESIYPDAYIIEVDGTVEVDASWDGSSITYNVDGLDVGNYSVVLTCTDIIGVSESDTVLVTVTSSGFSLPFDNETLILIGIGILALLIIGFIVCKKRGKK